MWRRAWSAEQADAAASAGALEPDDDATVCVLPGRRREAAEGGTDHRGAGERAAGPGDGDPAGSRRSEAVGEL